MHPPVRDRGAMLIIVLVVTAVLSMSVIGIAGYVATDLRYGRVTMDRADRLAATDAVMNYAIDQLKLRNAGCLLSSNGPQALPGLNSPVNGASTTVTCERAGGGIGDIQAWAAVMTGIGVPANSYLLSSQSGNGSEAKLLGGPVYMERVTTSSFNLGPAVKIKDGPLFYHDATCATPATAASLPSTLIFEPNLIYGPICSTENWTIATVGADPDVPNLSLLPPNPLPTTTGSCQVFSPGVYTAFPNLGSNVYFKSGDYYLLNVAFTIDKSTVTAGYPDPTIVSVPELPISPDCQTAMAADPNKVAPNLGATFYLGGTSNISIQTQGSLEIMPRLHGANYVSIHALCSTTDPVTAAGCDQTGGPTGVPSLLTATGAQPIVYTDPGNQKQLITHGLFYAPTGRLEFGNATNTAKQEVMGGLVVARLVLQSSASASNFKISVAVSPVNYKVVLVATAKKNGTTRIRAVVDYRPYEAVLGNRLAISSWWVL